MGGWAPIVLVGVLSGAALDARAEDVSSRCGADVLSSGRVARVIDGRSFVLDDGREIRLASLEVPAAAEAPAAGEAARAALVTMLAGKTIALRGTAAAPDRDRRRRAHSFVR